MNQLKGKKGIWKRLLCLILCAVVISTELPLTSIVPNEVSAAVKTRKKFIKTQAEVFVPTEKEKVTITFNLESTKVVDIYVKDGNKIIANLVNGKKYEGKYVPHELVWQQSVGH